MSGGGSKPGERRGGRAAGTPNKATAELRELARLHAPEALAELARLARHADSEATRVAAIKELLDRGFGRAPQMVDDDVPVEQPERVVTVVIVDPDGTERAIDSRRVIRVIGVQPAPKHGTH